MSKKIGNLLVSIGVDLTDFEKKMDTFKKEWRRLGMDVQDAATQIGTAFGGVSLAIGAGLGVAVKKAADFEQGLSNIKAVSGATSQEMEQLKALALEMGANTKYSATQAATGIEELVKAGVSMTDITNGGLKGALSLATAGGLELAEAAEIASTALNAFRKDGLSVSNAADILAGAANASATSVGELKFGLSSVSAVASSVGMTFEDTTTALAVFAQNGLKGSDAGTSLKTMLMNLQPSTDKARALFEELNLVAADGSSIFFDAEGKLKSLDQIAGILQDSMSGLTDAQRLQKMETIFGSDAIRAANILFKEGETGVSNMKKAMGKVTAEQVAAEKMNNLNGAIEQLKGSFETLMISLGETLIPVLKDMAKWLGGIVDWFNDLPAPVKKFMVIGAALAAVLSGLIAVVAFLVAGLGALAAVEWAVLWPILAIVAAVALIIAAFIALGVGINKLYNSNEQFRKGVDTVWTAIKNIIKIAIDTIRPIALELWAQIKDTIKGFWEAVKPIFTTILNAATELFGGMNKEGTSKLNTLKTVFKTVFGAIGNYLKIAIAIWGTIIKTSLTAVTTIFRVAFNATKAVVELMFHTTTTIIKNAMDIIKGIFKTIMALISGDWKGAWKAIKETVSNVFGDLKTYFTNVKTIFSDAGKNIMKALADGVLGAGKGVVDSVKGVVKKIRDFLPFSPAKVGPLSDLDKLDFAGPITDAMKAGTPDVQAQMNSMLTVPDVNPSVTTDMGGGTTLIMQLDSKTIAKKTFEHLGGTLRMRGAVT